MAGAGCLSPRGCSTIRDERSSRWLSSSIFRQALRCALSALAADNQIIVVDQFALDAPKTREVRKALDRLVGNDQSALILVAERDEALENSVRNLANARTLRATYLNVRDLLMYDRVIIPQAALEVIENHLGRTAAKS